jgi:hypothetical protein
MAPGTVVAGLTIESSGVIWWQWVTFFIVGNVFAGFWLVLALLNAHPDIVFKVRQLLGKLGLGGGDKKKAHHQHHSKEQDKQEQQNGDAAKAAAAALAPAGAVPQLTLPTAGAGKGPTPRHSTELGSPLRSHRSRPQPPPMLVVEQAISPRPSVTPKLSGLISPQASQPYSPSSHAGYATPRERGSFESEASAAAGGGAAAVGEDSDDTFTDASSLEGEPLLVKLEWRNLCYAVKAASGLRLIVQVCCARVAPVVVSGTAAVASAAACTGVASRCVLDASHTHSRAVVAPLPHARTGHLWLRQPAGAAGPHGSLWCRKVDPHGPAVKAHRPCRQQPGRAAADAADADA